MTRLTLAITVLVAPLTATTSWGQDVAYWQAAHTWQTSSPVTYYAHTAVVALLAATVVRKRRQPTSDRTPPRPRGPKAWRLMRDGP